ncbi:MAG: hypothetical protein Q4D38_10745 [Planctomycetia bacterium]|nr:hypothetical protein [Planctomycetia bacterium]
MENREHTPGVMHLLRDIKAIQDEFFYIDEKKITDAEHLFDGIRSLFLRLYSEGTQYGAALTQEQRIFAGVFISNIDYLGRSFLTNLAVLSDEEEKELVEESSDQPDGEDNGVGFQFGTMQQLGRIVSETHSGWNVPVRIHSQADFWETVYSLAEYMDNVLAHFYLSGASGPGLPIFLTLPRAGRRRFV